MISILSPGVFSPGLKRKNSFGKAALPDSYAKAVLVKSFWQDRFEQYGVEQHGFEQHGFEQHGFEQHGFEQHGFEQYVLT